MVNRVLAVLFAVGLIALGVLVPGEVVKGALGKGHWLLPWENLTTDLTRNSWQAGPVRAVLVGVAVVGLLLLLAELKPRRPSTLPLTPLTAGVDAGTTRRSLRHALQRAAREVDGVSGAHVKVGRRKAKVTARAHLRSTDGLTEQVSEHVSSRLASLGLVKAPQVAVKVQKGKR